MLWPASNTSRFVGLRFNEAVFRVSTKQLVMLLAQHHQVNQAIIHLEEHLSQSNTRPGRRYKLLRLRVRLRRIQQRFGQRQIDRRTAVEELEAIRYDVLDFLSESEP